MIQAMARDHGADLVTNGVIGGVAAAAWLLAAAVQLRRRQAREAAWSASLPVLAGIAGLLGLVEPRWHVVMTGLVAGVALRNAALERGAPRWLTVAGLVAWGAAMARARLIFG